MGVQSTIDKIGASDPALIALAVRLASDLDALQPGADTSKLALQLRLCLTDLRAQVQPEDATDDPYAALLTNVRGSG
jgi:hypothetical protein